MKKALFFILITLLGLQLNAQNKFNYHTDFEKSVLDNYISKQIKSNLELQLAADKNVDEVKFSEVKTDYNKLLVSLQQKKNSFKKVSSFLSWMFYKVHRKVLKDYKQYSSLATTIETGKYDCLSATSLYALLLSDLGYTPKLIETTYHIYLMVEENEQQFLFESTDPIYGFVSSQVEIDKRIEGYNQVAIENSSKPFYNFKTSVQEQVSSIKLVGLHYYNEAVAHYNSKQLSETIDLLEKASFFYHSDRITEFGLVLANAIYNDDTFSDDLKVKSINRVSAFLKADKSLAVN